MLTEQWIYLKEMDVDLTWSVNSLFTQTLYCVINQHLSSISTEAMHINKNVFNEQTCKSHFSILYTFSLPIPYLISDIPLFSYLLHIICSPHIISMCFSELPIFPHLPLFFCIQLHSLLHIRLIPCTTLDVCQQ